MPLIYQGFYYRPTVVAGATQEDEIVRREVFGPVQFHHAVFRFHQAVAWANDSASWPCLKRRLGPATWAARSRDGGTAALWLTWMIPISCW